MESLYIYFLSRFVASYSNDMFLIDKLGEICRNIVDWETVKKDQNVKETVLQKVDSFRFCKLHQYIYVHQMQYQLWYAIATSEIV